jgi:hypothetical protein
MYYVENVHTMQTEAKEIVITVREGTLLYDFQKLEQADYEAVGLKGRAFHSALEKVRRRQATFETALLQCHDGYERKRLMDYLRTVSEKQVGDLTIHDIIESLETT